MAKIEIEGLEKLQKKLKDNITLDDVKKVVRHNGQQLTEKMVNKADFTRGYATGTTKRSISLEMKDSGMTAEVEPETEYAPCSNRVGIWQHMLENRAKSVKILENIGCLRVWNMI